MCWRQPRLFMQSLGWKPVRGGVGGGKKRRKGWGEGGRGRKGWDTSDEDKVAEGVEVDLIVVVNLHPLRRSRCLRHLPELDLQPAVLHLTTRVHDPHCSRAGGSTLSLRMA